MSEIGVRDYSPPPSAKTGSTYAITVIAMMKSSIAIFFIISPPPRWIYNEEKEKI
jgi:hypothetical protein